MPAATSTAAGLVPVVAFTPEIVVSTALVDGSAALPKIALDIPTAGGVGTAIAPTLAVQLVIPRAEGITSAIQLERFAITAIRQILSRFEDVETGQELVTIQDLATGQIFTRPSKLMQIYQMGYGEKWRKAAPFPCAGRLERPGPHRRLDTRFEGRNFTSEALGAGRRYRARCRDAQSLERCPSVSEERHLQ